MLTLPTDIRFIISDEKKVRAAVEGDVLHVEAEPGFVYGRLNRQSVLQNLNEAASSIAGREIRAILSEMRQAERAARSIEELRQFKEVTIK